MKQTKDESESKAQYGIAASGKYYAFVIKSLESDVWVVGLRGHLVSEQ